MNWIKTSRTVHADGSAETRYEAVGTDFVIESRKRPIPHANGVGVWMHTEYFLIFPDGHEKMMNRLMDAKAAAEKLTALTASHRNCERCANKINGECQVWECRFVQKEEAEK